MRHKEIAGIPLRTPAVLAPMAGVTDAAFRAVCAQAGAGMTYTEMVSAKSVQLAPTREIHLRRKLPDDPSPAALQIFGREPEVMAEIAEAYGADYAMVDINMGCPAQKIVKNGQGAALLQDIHLAQRIVAACVARSLVPVSVKLRAGWDKEHIVAGEFARMAQDYGAAAVTLHARTREQFYSGKADWDLIAAVKASLSIPVIGNGDIFSAQDALRMLEETGCDAVMIGRGALGNPWIFTQIDAALREKPIHMPTLYERAQMLRRQAVLLAQVKDDRRVALEMRKHAAWYLKGLHGAAAMKKRAFAIDSLADIMAFADWLDALEPESNTPE